VTPAYADRNAMVRGLYVHYQEWAAPAGAPVLLMVHGITMQSHAFDGAAQQLCARYRCLALDLRGHGESERSAAGEYGYEDYAQDAIALLDSLGIERFHYLGTSLGGRVGMTMARVHAGRLASIALNDITPDSTARGLERIVAVFGADRTYASVQAYVEQALFVYAPRLKAVPMKALVANARWTLRGEGGALRPKFDPRALAQLAEANLREANSRMLWEGFRSLACPILILRAEQSDILTADSLARMLAAQPRAKAVQVPGVGHPPALIEPASQQALAEFFG
jgi:pimeloyl-ACP methyl ester carboxylesterase